MRLIGNKTTLHCFEQAFLLSAFLFATQAFAQEVADKKFTEGANCLFIGHSFFIPVAKSFDKLATRSELSSHHARFVFSPGLGGSPRGLWENTTRKQQIEKLLAGGNVELLGMTVAGQWRTPLEDYRKWIDLARKYNPKTQFLIGQYWIPGGPKIEADQYAKANETIAQKNFEIVKKLRKAYPENHIDFIHYGKIASELMTEFHKGNLPEVKQLVGRNSQSLFLDGLMGHGGVLIHDLSARLWLHILYGVETKRLFDTSVSEVAKDVLREVIEHNKPFQ